MEVIGYLVYYESQGRDSGAYVPKTMGSALGVVQGMIQRRAR